MIEGTRLVTGCIYGQYSSLEDFSYDIIRYVGMTGTTKDGMDAQALADIRLQTQLGESAEKCGNPAKIAWYQSVIASGGQIISHILAEAHEVTRQELGALERDWIEKLGGPMSLNGTVVQLFNLTHGGDGGWSVIRDEEWIEGARQRMIDRYATEESRRTHGEKMRGMYLEHPELREQLSRIQTEAQNRPERLQQNREHALALWQNEEYRQQVLAVRACQFCHVECGHSMAAAKHEAACELNPDRRDKAACAHCGKEFVDPARHWAKCKKNPNRIAGKLHGSRPKVLCPECGTECGAGAGLKAHVKWNHAPRTR